MWNPKDAKGKEQPFSIRDIWLAQAP